MATPSPENPGLFNWFLICALGLIWGGAFMSVTLALEGFPPTTVAAGRSLIGAVCLIFVANLLGQGLDKVPSSRAWLFIAFIGAGSIAAPTLLLSFGQQVVPSAFAGVTMGAVPLIVLPLAYIFSPEEGIGPRRVLGMCLGFVGLVLLIGQNATQSTGNAYEVWGRLACLGAAAGYAFGSIVTRRAPPMPPLTFAAGTLAVSALVLLPIAMIADGLPEELPAKPTAALIYAALMPTALAAVMRTHVITTAGSVFMSLTSYQVPIWAVILGITFMGESLPPQLFGALAIILLGIAISQSRSLSDFMRRRKS